MSSDSLPNAPATSSGCAAGVIILSVLCQKESRNQVINFPFLRMRSEVFRELLDMNNTNGFPPGVLLDGFPHISSHRLVKAHVWSCLKMSITTPIPPTRTHTAGAEALRASDAQLSPCFREPAGKAAGGNPAPAMFRKGAPTRKKGWGGFPGVAADFFFFLTMSIHGLKSKGIPKRGGE